MDHAAEAWAVNWNLLLSQVNLSHILNMDLNRLLNARGLLCWVDSNYMYEINYSRNNTQQMIEVLRKVTPFFVWMVVVLWTVLKFRVIGMVQQRHPLCSDTHALKVRNTWRTTWSTSCQQEKILCEVLTAPVVNLSENSRGITHKNERSPINVGVIVSTTPPVMAQQYVHLYITEKTIIEAVITFPWNRTRPHHWRL